MTLIKVSLYILVIVIAALLTIRHKKAKGGAGISFSAGGLIVGVLILIVLAVLLPAVGFVPAGYRGVVLRFGAVTGRVLPEGIYVITPVADSVELMPVQVAAFHADSAAVSKDLQEVSTQVTLNYYLDPKAVGKIYQSLRHDYEDRIIKPAIQESVKASTAKFTAEQLVTMRSETKTTIENSLHERLAVHGIMMETVSITNFDFTQSFKQAVEAKVVAQQNVLTEQRKLESVKLQAQQKVEQAKAEAEALRIQKLEVTAELVELRKIEVEKLAVEKWNGTLPYYVGGTAPVPIMDIFKK